MLSEKRPLPRQADGRESNLKASFSFFLLLTCQLPKFDRISEARVQFR